ncbi:MAG: hypothetical protein FD173_2338 [Gallionellaceae bacterium]|nr:MAG: hypothetical protein FD173_2338 [Gallionellaceae bacterium]
MKHAHFLEPESLEAALFTKVDALLQQNGLKLSGSGTST